MHLIYSQGRVEVPEGAAFRNPRFFVRPEEGVTVVTVHGDWPKIASAYQEAGAKVQLVDVLTRKLVEAPAPEAPAVLGPKANEVKGAVPIPEDWRDLPWSGGADVLTIRQLAAAVSDEPVLNRKAAIAAVEAEIERRAATEVTEPA